MRSIPEQSKNYSNNIRITIHDFLDILRVVLPLDRAGPDCFKDVPVLYLDILTWNHRLLAIPSN